MSLGLVSLESWVIVFLTKMHKADGYNTHASSYMVTFSSYAKTVLNKTEQVI